MKLPYSIRNQNPMSIFLYTRHTTTMVALALPGTWR
jgi:hypothetical protein